MRIPQRPPSAFDLLQNRQRDLSDVFGQERFREFTRLAQQRYWHWDQLRRNAGGEIDAELAWAAIKLGRVQQYRSLPLYGSETQPLWFNIPDQVQHELMLIDQQLAGRLGAEDESPLSQHQRDRFIISALRDEAIASSMLEGAATTRRDASQMLKTGRKPRTQGERMVLNNYQAIQFIRENRKVDLSPAFLLELQAILTERTLDKKDAVGRFRTADDDITVVDGRDNEVIHVPPPAAELPERLERLCRFANQHSSVKEFIHPVARACVLHFQLGFDHPFCDGNGRTARAIFYWLVLRAGYWLFEYLPISRLIYRGPAKYARAFLYCETDEFDVTYFLMYKAKIISRARQELREYIGAKQQQIAQARRLFSSDGRLNHRQQEVVLQATRNPDQAFTIADHQGRYAVVYGTARSDLMKLAQWGYLEQQKIGKRYDFLPAPRLASLDGE